MSENTETIETTKVEEKPLEAKPKKKKGRSIYAHYKIEEGKLKRLRPFCERCGPGYFMANHGDRYTCGHCGFTRYKITEKSR